MITLSEQIVYTNEAKCRDCYKCVRVCPVNAIKMSGGQASVVNERCIQCGTCIRNCPQNAKTYRRDIHKVRELLDGGFNTAVSIAPSFPALFNEWEIKRIPSLLRKMGFRHVFETAVGAYYSAYFTEKEYCSGSRNNVICSACPSVVNYIRKYRPEITDQLAPVDSPMVAHAKIIRNELGDDVKTVFIGPCIAKKGEAGEPGNNKLIEAVLTFEELSELIVLKNISIETLEESGFDSLPSGDSRLYPLSGGFFRASGAGDSGLQENTAAATGFEEVTELISMLGREKGIIAEPLFCQTGCTNGPGIRSETDLHTRRRRVIRYAAAAEYIAQPEPVTGYKEGQLSFVRKISPDPVKEKMFTEAQVREVLEHTGRINDSDRLDCGACGYSSCYDKALAVLRGMAEKEMCLPYMKKMAEQRSDKIIESTPNAIVILNDKLEIIKINPAFRRFFVCGNSSIGKPLSSILDPEHFIRLREGREDKIEIQQEHSKYGLVCHELIYKLREENQIVGIFVDITKNLTDTRKLDDLRRQTIIQARELLNHQIEMAQKMAKFLGENTARGEVLVENLIQLTADQSKSVNDKSAKNWLWDTATSKQ